VGVERIGLECERVEWLLSRFGADVVDVLLDDLLFCFVDCYLEFKAVGWL